MLQRLHKILITLCIVGTVGGVIFAGNRSVPPSEPARKSPSAPVGNTSGKESDPNKIVDFMADRGYLIPSGDTTATVLVGNFAAQHNGALITCDSAIRYSDKHLEFFGNVLINKNTTYIYGDRADYNGDINQARVYSQLVKVVDGDATLYTYDFMFNTLDNVGTFDRGGMLINRDNQLESVRGYYYADTHEMIAVDQVEMHNDTYQLRGDSVVYNTETDLAHFFDRTNIWNEKGDYIYADRGRYEKPRELYVLTLNGYILTEKQELWSDSLNYYRVEGHALLHRNIQIDDTEHKVLGFGDYGEYWDKPGNALLTRQPSVVSYDTSQGDSLYMCADTMFLFTILKREQARADSLAAVKLAAETVRIADSLSGKQTKSADRTAVRKVPEKNEPVAEPKGVDTLGKDGMIPDSTAGDSVLSPLLADSLAPAEAGVISPADSLTEAMPELSPQELKERMKAQADSLRAEKKTLAATARAEKLDQIAKARQARATAKLDAQKLKEQAQIEKQKVQRDKRLAQIWAKKRARVEKAVLKGKLPASALDSLFADSLRRNAIPVDSLIPDSLAQDSLAVDSLLLASLRQDSLRLDSLRQDSLARIEKDSLFRLIKGYRRVKIFRSDFQAVCDSLVSISTDSTILLYIDPVLWNQTNQITSDQMKIYTENSNLQKAEFIGRPVMSSEVDTMSYNQVTGKLITAYFRDNKIYRNDVDGNVQTLYYMQEEDSPEPVSLMVIDSGTASYYIENNTVTGITYRNQPTYSIFPMDKIPETQLRFLDDFKWEGDRRPTLREVFDRKIRPSERKAKSALRRPDFPISRRIETYKKTLIDSGRWVDRDDKLSPEAIDWLHALGY